jgi:RNA polymerase sigma-70 factor, ECF subfamily
MGISDDPGDESRLKELLYQAQKGDAQAFCLLAQPLEQRLFHQALGLCRNETAAEDLVSETLIEAWKCLSRYDQSCRLTTWLYAILLHRYQRSVRRARSRPISMASLNRHESEPLEKSQSEMPATDASPAENAVRSELSAQVRQWIDALDEKHKDVILLRFFEGASLSDMALLLRCSEGTVKSRLHYALNKLRKMKIPMNLLETRSDI